MKEHTASKKEQAVLAKTFQHVRESYKSLKDALKEDKALDWDNDEAIMASASLDPGLTDSINMITEWTWIAGHEDREATDHAFGEFAKYREEERLRTESFVATAYAEKIASISTEDEEEVEIDDWGLADSDESDNDSSHEFDNESDVESEEDKESSGESTSESEE